MRNAFADEVTKLAQVDERVILLSGDIGNRLFNNYKNAVPARFINCGVAEQNMVGMAAGLALSGLRPITYTITPFMTIRCLEQIRVDVCYQNLPVTIVSVGGGLSYASLGPTHHACEDIAVLRALPNMTILCPADPLEVRAALHAAHQHDGPVYIRLGKKNEPNIFEEIPQFEIGKSRRLRQGTDVCLLNTGFTLPLVMAAADTLEADGYSVEVVHMPTVKPLDTETLTDLFSRFPVITTVEEHSVVGGFGAAVAEWVVDEGIVPAALCRIGTPDHFLHESGSTDYARKVMGITVENIVSRTRARLETVVSG